MTGIANSTPSFPQIESSEVTTAYDATSENQADDIATHNRNTTTKG